MRWLACALPVVVFAATVLYGWRYDFAQHVVGAFSFLLFGSCIVARFLWRRSDNLAAHLVSVALLPNDDDDRKEQVELVAMIGAVALMLLAVILPWSLMLFR